MIPINLLLEHFLALGLLWAWALVAGLPLIILLRVPLGLTAAVPLGITVWTIALYVFCFPHGLICAAALGVLSATAVWRCCPSVSRTPFTRVPSKSGLILLIGCAAYATLLVTHYVPPGMDASMYATAARLIAQQQRLPYTYAPIVPQLHLPAVNLGIPALAAVAIWCGVSPVSAILASEQLTFSVFILTTYFLLRLWTTRLVAAFLAVYATWNAAGVQKTVEWGGFPTVMALALGLFAMRLLIDLTRRPSYRTALPLGFTVASVPLVHGISAAVWLYAAAPMVLLLMIKSRQRRAAMKPLAASAGIALLVVAVYFAVGRVVISGAALDWVRDWQARYAPRNEGWLALFSGLPYIRQTEGNAFRAGLLAAGVLLIRRRYYPVIAVAASTLVLSLLIANSKHWLLPLSALLYPERVVYWTAPLSAVAMALAWQSLSTKVRRSPMGRLIVPGVLALIAFGSQVQNFQRSAFRPTITRPQWQALLWAAENLDREHDYVSASYNSTGSYLPAVAGIATTGWHLHFLALEDARIALRDRVPTHRFLVRGAERTDLSPSDVVFENSDVTILRLKPPIDPLQDRKFHALEQNSGTDHGLRPPSATGSLRAGRRSARKNTIP